MMITTTMMMIIITMIITGGDYPNDSIAEDGQNTETSPGDLRKRAVSQTPVRNHQLTLL